MLDGYCTVADVTALTKLSYSDTSSPSIDEVESFITQGYHRVNLLLKAQGVETPVVEADMPEQYSALSSLNTLYAAMKAESDSDERTQALSAMYEREKKDMIDSQIFFNEADNPATSGVEQSAGRVRIDANEALDDEEGNEDFFRFFGRQAF